ncbi:MAG: hypothetical protein WCW14_02635 [Candidatus Paceibacterota bacterium]
MEIETRIRTFLGQIDEILTIASMGLLKADKLHDTKKDIEIKLSELGKELEEVDQLAIEKITPKWRNQPKSGIFINSDEVNLIFPLRDVLFQLLAKYGESNKKIKTIKKRFKTDDVFVESRSRDEDHHILIGRRDGKSDKAHMIVDGRTGDQRVEAGQQQPTDIAEKIETIVTFKDGKKIKTTRESVEEIPLEKPISHLEIIEQYVEGEDWYEELIDHKEVWICKKDNLYQIHKNRDSEDFSEPWTQVYPNALGSGKYSVDLTYNNNHLKRFDFIYCDGARIHVVMPEMKTDIRNIWEGKDIKNGSYRNVGYFWKTNSLGVKLTRLIGFSHIQ